MLTLQSEIFMENFMEYNKEVVGKIKLTVGIKRGESAGKPCV